jgi:hypothetical protein
MFKKESPVTIKTYNIVKIDDLSFVARTYYIQDNKVIKTEDSKPNMVQYALAHIRNVLFNDTHPTSQGQK